MLEESDLVVVTGAGGFIGTQLSRALLRRGCRLRVNLRSHDRNILRDMLPFGSWENLELSVGDLSDPEYAEELVRDATIIAHLAGATGPERPDRSVRPLFTSNVVATFNLLEAARRMAFLRKFVLTSSSSSYGVNSSVAINEERATRPGSIYSATKIAADTLAESFFRAADLPIVILRLFNVYGPCQKRDAVIPTIIAQALETGRVRLGNLKPQRDFTYVEDVVRSYLAAIDAPVEVTNGECFNIGTGVATSIGDLAAKILEILGIEQHVEIDPERVRPSSIDFDIIAADRRKAERLLNWRPETDLVTGLTQTIDWWRGRSSAALRGRAL